jgi:sugar-phosphatase
VVTSGITALATARLAAAGLPPPPLLVTADDIDNGKPAPDGYLAAARGLRLPPDRTVVLEDSPAGIAAARAAGVGAIIGVGPRAREADVTVAVEDLRAVRWSAGGLVLTSAD